MKRVTLNIGDVQNANAISDKLGALMNFPGWNDANAEAWIDMVTLYDRPTPLIPGFRSASQEFFLIDVVADQPVEKIPPGLMNALQSQIAQINRTSVRRVGRPILALVWS